MSFYFSQSHKKHQRRLDWRKIYYQLLSARKKCIVKYRKAVIGFELTSCKICRAVTYDTLAVTGY